MFERLQQNVLKKTEERMHSAEKSTAISLQDFRMGRFIAIEGPARSSCLPMITFARSTYQSHSARGARCHNEREVQTHLT